MDYLRSFAEEHGLKEISGIIAGHPLVQGAVLTLDDLWLQAWRMEESGRSGEWERWIQMWRHWGPWPNQFPRMDMGMDAQSWITTRPPNLYWLICKPSG